MPSTITTRVTRAFVRFAVNFELDLQRCETAFAPAALHALAAFTDPGAESSTEVCAVAGAPGPDAAVGCVGAAERLAAV